MTAASDGTRARDTPAAPPVANACPQSYRESLAPVSFLETGVIYCDENVRRLAQFPAECVDLIYLDPPFFSNKHYEVIWGDEAEVRSFEDRWEGGIEVYIAWMRERLMELYRVLKPTGSIFLHCDWHAAHRLRVLLDAIFQPRNFRNEIIWCYYGPGSPRMGQFNRKHDNIYWYANGREWTFNRDAVRIPHSDKTRANYKEGLVGSGFEGAEHLIHEQGKVPEDWWPIAIAPRGAEYLGYPTQKPEALLDRIIRAASKPGDIVLDPFCGCGTTIAVAHRLKREWIGIDISPTAVGLMKWRMEKLGATPRLIGMPVTEDELRKLRPFEFQNWVIQRMNGTHSARKTGDMGIDGYSFLEHLPIQVKQSEKVGRNVVDNFETAIDRDGHHKGFIVGFDFTSDAKREVARVAVEKNVEIRLVRVIDLLQDVPGLITPTREAEQMYFDLLPKPRDKKARPSAEELVESDRETV
jgi:DNA modification methylase